MRMLLWAAVLAVSACAAGQYPVSRAVAGRDDPVLRMTVPPLPGMPVAG